LFLLPFIKKKKKKKKKIKIPSIAGLMSSFYVQTNVGQRFSIAQKTNKQISQRLLVAHGALNFLALR
jgi:hypothetical protein